MMDVEIINNSENDVTIQTHQCNHCNEHQLSELDLRNHLMSCLKAEEIIIEINDDDDVDHENVSEETLPKAHVTKVGEKNFKCDTCAQSFISKSNAVSHFNRIHLGIIKIAKYPQCDKSLSSINKLKSHVKRKHGTGKIFECNVCGKKFSQSDDLKSHENRHKINETKFYKCDICQKDLYQVKV